MVQRGEKMEVFKKNTNDQDYSDKTLTKKKYKKPQLAVYGDVGRLTLKYKGLQDHNKSNGNDMGWS